MGFECPFQTPLLESYLWNHIIVRLDQNKKEDTIYLKNSELA